MLRSRDIAIISDYKIESCFEMASINRGEVKEKRFQLFEPEGCVLASPGASHRFIKKCFRPGEK